ncbi:hypothetical protein [Pararhizobium sp. O133]|uniref:hypothetical protein n=1 Tax=Pararhizobium sp. O133 TaxID=3449278 RepID=UPI003F682B78
MNVHARPQRQAIKSEEAIQREAGIVDFLMTCSREDYASGLLIFATMPAMPCAYSADDLRADIKALQSGLEDAA